MIMIALAKEKMWIPLVLTDILIFGSSLSAQNTTQERPNIILIVADDLGYSDLGCYGGEIHTPHLDSLAYNGLRYNQFYNASRSCPSRASLLTGLYPHQAGVGHMVTDRGYEGYRGNLAENTVTLAEALKLSGYQTGMTGKWHVSSNTDPSLSKDTWPLQRGFDRFYGTLSGHGSLYDPKCLFDGNTPVKAEGDYYYTEAVTSYATSYIESFSKNEAPFFLYIAYTAPHYPLHARQKFCDRYKNKFTQGWDILREKRYKNLIRMGMIDSTTILPPKDQQCYDWETEEHKEWQQNRMEVYAAMIEQMDCSIGEIIHKLDQLNESDNTLIIFISDNGASNEGHLYNTIERSGEIWKDNMIPKKTLSGEKVIPGDIPGYNLGGPATYGSYGPQWAHLSVTPFKRYKSWMHEGGISTPMIAYWPDKIKDKGKIKEGIYSIIDFMPTFIELAESTYPDSIRNKKTIEIAGVSLVKSFTDNMPDDSRTLFWEHEGNRAIIKDQWKLVSEYPGEWSTLREYPKKGEWELYNLAIDRTEIKDISEAYPERVRELATEWNNWAKRSQVIDWKILESKK